MSDTKVDLGGAVQESYPEVEVGELGIGWVIQIPSRCATAY